MQSSARTPHLTLGIGAALGAGLLWGLVFIAPLLLPSYPPALLTFGRYLGFGLITLPIAWWQRTKLLSLLRSHWRAALQLSLVGNFAYYFALSAAIQLAGAPLPTLIIGTLPVVIALVANRSAARHGARAVPLAQLLPALGLIGAGLSCVNAHELEQLNRAADASMARYASGLLCAWLAVAAWTWYPIHNARWLQAHPQHNATLWASAQGLATLPVALVGFVLCVSWYKLSGDTRFAMGALGAQPLRFIGLMLILGLCASWLGTMLWNVASQHTPTALTGQLIVFETLAALAYAYAYYQRWPRALEWLGIALLIAGVLWGVRLFSRKQAVMPREERAPH